MRVLFACLLVVPLGGGCSKKTAGGGGAPSASAPAETPAGKAAPAGEPAGRAGEQKAGEAAGTGGAAKGAASGDDGKGTGGAKAYALHLTGPQVVAPGTTATLRLRLEARAPYHVNDEYPIKLTLSPASGLQPVKAVLTRKDATKFAEKEARFEPQVKVASPGQHAVKGTFKFSVCTDTQCEVKREAVTWTFTSGAE